MSKLSTRNAIQHWLEHKACIRGFSINDDLTVDVEGDVIWVSKGITEFPVTFRSVSGDFYCQQNNLTTLAGVPRSVGGEFRCHNNKLTSLEHAPEKVGGSFHCYGNKLTSLDGAPRAIGGNFNCMENSLTSLSGGPEIVPGSFYCKDNPLTSLAGAPQKVGDEFSTSMPDEIFYPALLALIESGAEFSAANLTGEIAAIRAELLAENMREAIGDWSEGVVVPRRNTKSRS